MQSLHVPLAVAGPDEEPKSNSTSAKFAITADELRKLIPALYQTVVDTEGGEAAEKHLQELFETEHSQISPGREKTHRGKRAGKRHKNHDRPLSEAKPIITITTPPSEQEEAAPPPSEVVAVTPSEPIASSEMPPAVEHNGKRKMSKKERDEIKKQKEREKKAAVAAKALEEEKARKAQEAQHLAEEQKRQDEELRRLELESQQAREESKSQATAKPTYESTLVTLNAAFAETDIDKRYAQFAQAGSAFADLKDDKRAQAKVLLFLLTGL